jgi:isopentenyl diphosphate isomerase/L-lactate dehydrogenase-like FMN-dependent dehydrogenase
MVWRSVISSIRDRQLDKCHNIADLRTLCRSRLPRAVFDYIDGGSGEEWALNDNVAAFQNLSFIPQMFHKSAISLKTAVLGRELSYPLIIAPTGGLKLIHPDGELAVARAAFLAGIYTTLSNYACTRMEELAVKEPTVPKMFQLYPVEDRDLTIAMITRARRASYDALCITIDSTKEAIRLRDRRNGLNVAKPDMISLFADVLMQPAWLYRYLRSKPDGFCNFDDHTQLAEPIRREHGMRRLSSISWEYLADLRREWGEDKPFAIKGILSPRDATLAAEIGATAVVVSNHGGRQLDSCISAIDALPAVADAVAGRVEIILDGGVRRGSDVLKAIALGAHACMVGRANVYGLGAGGARGVEKALRILIEEMEIDLRLVGCSNLQDLSGSQIIRRNSPRRASTQLR